MSSVSYPALLKLFLVKDNFEQYAQYVQTDWLPRESYEVFKALGEYQVKFNKDVSVDEFAPWFFTVLQPEMPRSKQKEYQLIFEAISSADVGGSIEEVLLYFKRELVKDKIRAILEENGETEELQECMDEYSKTRLQDNVEGLKNELSSLITQTDRSGGLKWKLDCLNKCVGPIIRGDLLIVAAYVNTGKTAFAISEATHMAKQLHEGHVLWLNNEEYDERVMRKVWQSALGATWQNITENKRAAEKHYLERMHGDMNRIKFFDIRDKTIADVKRICTNSNAKLIVIDQADKIKSYSGKDGAEHIRLGALYGALRTIANAIAPVMIISQTNATARWQNKETHEVEYQRIIDMNQLRGSAVDKPAEADAVITIGQDVRFPKSRYISVPKNKLEGLDPMWRELRGYEVNFDGEKCRYDNPKD